ncbi:MAG: esterase-like activity of phytase family protein [Pseudomonadota bacterium]
MRLTRLAHAAALVALLSAIAPAHAIGTLIAIGSLSSSSAGADTDLSGLSGTLENGLRGDLLGGIGSGLAWAGGNVFLALPDRGPNATVYNPLVDNTSSYIPRFHEVTLALTASASGGLPYNLTPTLSKTTLLYSTTALNYGNGSAGTGSVTTGGITTAYTLGSGVPGINTASKNYFTGRSDGFGAGLSTNASNARLDPEAIRVSKDGKSVFVSDEYGPYVYQFDRSTGERLHTYTLPGTFAISNLSAVGATEISTNATNGRITNKGMEGLAISPDGKTLIGFMQSPLAQDGGDGGRANRIVTIDVATGATKQYAYDNKIGSKNYNSSEILALNDHQFIVLERDGKGLGDGSAAVVKQLFSVDLSGAQDVSGLSGEAALLAKAPAKTLFLDIAAALKAYGYASTDIPAKLEGLAWGEDRVEGGITKHTLIIANDNDFIGAVAGTNKFFAFSVTDAELTANGLSFTQQSISAVPEAQSYLLALAGLAFVGMMARRRA